MIDKIISKYALKEILEHDKDPLALTDKNQKILWFNKNFKLFSPSERIKGKDVAALFNLKKNDSLTSEKLTPVSIKIPGSENNLLITPLKTDKKLDGFLLKLESKKSASKVSSSEKSITNFHRDFHEILSILIKEKSFTKIADEILSKGITSSSSLFGLFLLIEEKNKFSFHYYDPDKFIENPEETNRELKDSLSFIRRWININKKALLIENVKTNIGFQLTEIFECKYLIVLPCFFEEALIGLVVLGRMKEKYSPDEIAILERLSSLLGFSIKSIKIRELNLALEDRLLQAQKLETIGKLSSGMAHDFNNLLSSIFGSLNLLKKRVPQSENVTRLIDNIENCSIRARDLTKGLLTFGKPTPKRKELIKPNLLLSEMIKIISQTFSKKVALNHDIKENLYDVLGNPTEIYQVILNLCVNAKEAMDEKGGILTLRARNISVNNKNIINFPLLNKGNYVCFTVRDNGSGINEDNLQKIFDPYFSTKEKETGSGLGLYVSYGIIKAHEGHIDVTSKQNEGTQFDVYLPSYEPTKINKETSSEKLILLADDEIMLRDLLAELLESSGFSVIRVISGTEALKVLTEELKVDLIILDYNMPEMNGLDCVTEIRKFNKEVPIILSSGSLGLNGQNIDMKKMGINSFVNKPYEFDTMLATIQELV
ncbi:MAG TPA: response regulator [Ignavibacteriaceae bacterium]|nr:response regulator [Ignavibacteriaceae bacterium]